MERFWRVCLPRTANTRAGMILNLVLLVLVIVGLLALQFNQYSRHGQAMSYKFENGEIARQIAESAIDEALTGLWQETESPTSEKTNWFLRNSRNFVSPERRSDTISLEVPITQKFALKMLPEKHQKPQPVITAQMRIIDFQRRERKNNNPFYPSEDGMLKETFPEGLGTFEIAVNVDIFSKPGIKVAHCTITRHHDFRSVSMVTNPARRGKYAHNALLDYVLFVRKGLTEFRDPKTHVSYNRPPGALLMIKDQILPGGRGPGKPEDAGKDEDAGKSGIPGKGERPGKIFFAGTQNIGDDTSDFVFLNVPESFKSHRELLPTLSKEIIHEVGLSECLQLTPSLEPASKFLGGLKGIFKGRVEPLWRPKYETESQKKEDEARQALALAMNNNTSNACKQNLEPWGIQIAESEKNVCDPAYVDAILEGALRQRFLYLVTFNLDLSGVSGSLPEALKTAKDNITVCLPVQSAGPDPAKLSFTNALATMKGPYSLVSSLEDSYAFRGGQEISPSVTSSRKKNFSVGKFFNFLGNEHDPKLITPYSLATLRYLMVERVENFPKTSVFNPDEGELHLRGVVRIQDPEKPVILKGKGSGPLTFSGTGVLIAEKGFYISSGIVPKNPGSDDFCVLFARNGNIVIDTEEPINAVLIAMGDGGGRVIPKKIMKVKGAMIVDYLDSAGWPAGTHTLEYNPTLGGRLVSKGPDTNDPDFFQIIPSPLITFQRISEGAE